MPRTHLIYNNVFSDEHGVVLSGEETWLKPTPIFERVSIPGRNGDLVRFTGAYSNVQISYQCGIPRDFSRRFASFTSALLREPGYHRLEDDYHPELFRMAAVSEITAPELSQYGASGSFALTFDCKPQSFLKSGEQPMIFESSGTLFNPTGYAAKPLLRVWGTGEVWIGAYRVTILSANDYTDLDCETEDAYKDDAADNRNSSITLNTDHFPRIEAGKQALQLGSGIQKVQIIPRWWTL